MQPTATTPTNLPATRLALDLPAAAVTVFGRVDLTIETDGYYLNPFDPSQVDLEVDFTPPTGPVISAPAFWYQDYDPATLAPTGKPGWRVRFTPTLAGRWQAQARLVQQPGLRSEPVSFEAAPDSAAKGFVRINHNNPRYFGFDDGSFFLPIGLNIGWANSLAKTVPDYERWFGRLSANGGNLARVWMADWSVGVEWNDTGLGDYSAREKQAWLLDQIFNEADKDNVYILLTLLNHGAFSQSVNPEWDTNPYNEKNGGMLSDPGAFVKDPAARDYFKRRLRYIASRWGYSTHLFAWEWWNEINWTPITDTTLKPWIVDMTAALRTYDPYQHLTTTSYSGGSNTTIWRLPELSFMQQHDYSGGDPVGVFAKHYKLFEPIAEKPVLVGELGYSSSGAADREEGIHLHNGLWAAPFEGYAGTALQWWWDTYVDPKDTWPEYKHFADFVQGEDLATMAPGTVETAKTVVALTLLSPKRALVWIRNKQLDAGQAAFQYNQTMLSGTRTPNWTFNLPVIKGVSLVLSGLADGRYKAYWYAPQTGEWLTATVVKVSGGRLTMAIPDFDHDLALKVVGSDEPHTQP